MYVFILKNWIDWIVFHFDKIRIKNPILVFHLSIDEQLTEVWKLIRYLFSICSQKKIVSSKAAGGGGTFVVYINTRNTWYGAFGRCWRVLLGRSKTVKDLSDLLKERYPNARGFSVRSIECFYVENGMRKKVFRLKLLIGYSEDSLKPFQIRQFWDRKRGWLETTAECSAEKRRLFVRRLFTSHGQAKVSSVFISHSLGNVFKSLRTP